MKETQIQGELAERELEALAKLRISEWLLEGDGTPDHAARIYACERQHSAALTLLAKPYAKCGWTDLESDLAAMNAEDKMWRSWARLALYHFPAVKDLRCGLTGETRQSLRKQLLAGSVSEIEHFLAEVRPGWNDGIEDDIYEQYLSARIQALEDLIARFDIEELKPIETMLHEFLPRERREWMTAQLRLNDSILPMIRKVIGIEAEPAGAIPAIIQLCNVTIRDDFGKWDDGLKTRNLPPQASETLRYLYSVKAFSEDSGKTNQEVAAYVVRECGSKAGADWSIRRNAFNSGKLPELYRKVIGQKLVKYGKSHLYWLKLPGSQ